MTNVVIKSPEEERAEFDARTLELVKEFRRQTERELMDIERYALDDDQLIGCLCSIQTATEKFQRDIEDRIEIRDDVSPHGFIASQQLSCAVRFGQADRVVKLLAQDGLIERMPWLSAVRQAVETRFPTVAFQSLLPSQSSIAWRIYGVASTASQADLKQEGTPANDADVPMEIEEEL